MSVSDLDEELGKVLDAFGAQYYQLLSTLGKWEDGSSLQKRDLKDRKRAESIELVKQAFIEDGWRKGYAPKNEYVGPDFIITQPSYTTEQLKAISEELSKPRMTGQEWYDRFIQELGKYTSKHDGVIDPEVVAKKAAGIE